MKQKKFKKLQKKSNKQTKKLNLCSHTIFCNQLRTVSSEYLWSVLSSFLCNKQTQYAWTKIDFSVTILLKWYWTTNYCNKRQQFYFLVSITTKSVSNFLGSNLFYLIFVHFDIFTDSSFEINSLVEIFELFWSIFCLIIKSTFEKEEN